MLREQMEYVKSHAWAAGTKRTLNSQAKDFKKFAYLIEIDSFPLDGETLCMYAIWLWVVHGLRSPKSKRVIC